MASNQGPSVQKLEVSNQGPSDQKLEVSEKGKKPTNEKTLDIVSINPLYFFYVRTTRSFVFLFGPICSSQTKKRPWKPFSIPSLHPLSPYPLDFATDSSRRIFQRTTAGSKGLTTAPLAPACSEEETQNQGIYRSGTLVQLPHSWRERRYIMQDGKWSGSI